MNKYRKFFAALIGVSALMAMRQFDVEVMGFEPIVLEMIVSALTAAGVYQVPNRSE
ncbi:hypothetical protein [Pseudohoeflea coraliihabitans]|uniref:Holin n=1 Tax=Pseudohoeflea coraliihabitans TaxID=2860393 RepID=A0ABS6WTP6_9HYPH|nr:hypothetical protein [Pseudohoeflea sp. DP4N28-3]MBW3099200.1 hypothetical protein [Pseudohoeflea sp. DP4N28-3]